jgi:hypothetical protein
MLFMLCVIRKGFTKLYEVPVTFDTSVVPRKWYLEVRWPRPDYFRIIPTDLSQEAQLWYRFDNGTVSRGPYILRPHRYTDVEIPEDRFWALELGRHVLDFLFKRNDKWYETLTRFDVTPQSRQEVWGRTHCPLLVQTLSDRIFAIDFTNLPCNSVRFRIDGGSWSEPVAVENGAQVKSIAIPKDQYRALSNGGHEIEFTVRRGENECEGGKKGFSVSDESRQRAA